MYQLVYLKDEFESGPLYRPSILYIIDITPAVVPQKYLKALIS